MEEDIRIHNDVYPHDIDNFRAWLCSLKVKQWFCKPPFSVRV